MRGRHEKRSRLYGRVGWTHPAEASPRTKSAGSDGRRKLLASILVALLLLVSGTAVAADETTTTTTPDVTTTTSLGTTTTYSDGTTTTMPSETTTTFSRPTTTPSSTTTTLLNPATSTPGTEDPSGSTAPPTLLPPPSEPDPEPEAVDFRVGHLPAPPIVFPLIGPNSFVDTFGAPRDGGRRRHAGIDIMARRGVPIVAVAAGVVEEIDKGTLAGQYVIVRHDNGWRSKYLHLDNDTPGSDDGLGSGYAKGLHVGMRVQPGTVLGFVGDSGNSEHTVPHLHFGLYQPNGLPINPYRALVAAPDAEPVYPTPIARTFNTELIGHIVPDGTGFNADMAVHGDHAYLGTSGNGEVCPGTGVRIINVSDPAEPEAVAAFAGADQFPGTATPSVWVGELATFGSHRTLAVVAVQLCDENDRASFHGRFAGLAIYDVGDPSNPVLLSTVHSGDRTGGVSHVDVTTDENRLLAAATVPGSYADHPESLGDVRVYDVTRPLVVGELSDWHIRRDGPPLLVEALGAFLGDQSLDATSVSWDATNRLVVSNSAAGVVTLDFSDVGDLQYQASTAADGLYGFLVGPRTSARPDLAASEGWRFDDALLVQNDYRLQPTFDVDGAPIGWSPQRLFDVSDPAKPRLVAAIATSSRSGGASILDGIYSPRASVRIGDSLQLVAWLSDGLRVIDLENPSEPKEAAFFVPPPRPDPHGWWVAPDGTRELPLVWDVVTDGEYVYVSDVNSGLWVFRITTPVVDRSTPLVK
jgi:murein DD-endopeptidase MepM/ murein hydrolase activator NlpD